MSETLVQRVAQRFQTFTEPFLDEPEPQLPACLRDSNGLADGQPPAHGLSQRHPFGLRAQPSAMCGICRPMFAPLLENSPSAPCALHSRSTGLAWHRVQNLTAVSFLSLETPPPTVLPSLALGPNKSLTSQNAKRYATPTAILDMPFCEV